MEKQKINLLEGLLNPQYWRYDKGGWTHYTCHDHAFSATEMDDTCGTCSGGKCCDGGDDFPHVYVDPEKLYLIDEAVYGDTIHKFTGIGKGLGELVDAVRNGNGWFENDKYEIRIHHEVTMDSLDNLSEKAKTFYTRLFELYKGLEE